MYISSPSTVPCVGCWREALLAQSPASGQPGAARCGLKGCSAGRALQDSPVQLEKGERANERQVGVPPSGLPQWSISHWTSGQAGAGGSQSREKEGARECWVGVCFPRRTATTQTRPCALGRGERRGLGGPWGQPGSRRVWGNLGGWENHGDRGTSGRSGEIHGGPMRPGEDQGGLGCGATGVTGL